MEVEVEVSPQSSSIIPADEDVILDDDFCRTH